MRKHAINDSVANAADASSTERKLYLKSGNIAVPPILGSTGAKRLVASSKSPCVCLPITAYGLGIS